MQRTPRGIPPPEDTSNTNWTLHSANVSENKSKIAQQRRVSRKKIIVKEIKKMEKVYIPDKEEHAGKYAFYDLAVGKLKRNDTRGCPNMDGDDIKGEFDDLRKEFAKRKIKAFLVSLKTKRFSRQDKDEEENEVPTYTPSSWKKRQNQCKNSNGQRRPTPKSSAMSRISRHGRA